VSRLPLRLRLALAFAVAMAVVLTAVGALLYVRLGDSLEEQIDDSLEARADAVRVLVRERGTALRHSDLGSGDDETFAQVLRRDGTVLASSSPAAAVPLVSRDDLARARDGRSFRRRQAVAGVDGGEARLLVAPLARDRLVLVLGASLEDRDEALAGLLGQLVVVGPLALLASSLAGYLLAGAALRPVEAMRRRAAEVSSERSGQRLPLPVARDEVYRLGETLNAMLGRLEAGLARERRFVADAGHELRTPLAILRTELELALRRPRSHDEVEQALRSAAEEVDRLVRLAEDLLVLARADEGALPLRPSAVDAGDLLTSVARRFDARAAAVGRVLEVDSDGGLSLAGDRLRLEQALGNVVDNALRYGAGIVRLEGELRNGSAELRVTDEGPGFPSDFLPIAFDRFTRADDARGGGASGLGLAIVAAIARAHGGSVRAFNAAAGGAVVALSLPPVSAASRARRGSRPSRR
jgi:two-component system, OmpR family, sensor kinase